MIIKKQYILDGYVDVVITGKSTERMINDLTRKGVSFYDVRKVSNHEIHLRMKYTEAFNLRNARKQYGCKIHFKKRGGVPHYYQNRRKWLPLVISIILVISFIFVLSNMVWKVEISGGSPEVRYEVDELIDSLGLNRGSFIQQMDSISNIEREIMNKVEEVSYVGIKRTGTAYHIMIEENKNNMNDLNRDPSNLVAEQTGTIQRMYVTNGRPVVKVNDFVKKDDVLVTGKLDDEKEIYTYSEGEVIAEVWYNVNGTINLATEKRDLIDDVEDHYAIKFGDYEWFPKQPRELSLLMEENKPVYFLFWKTPISIQKKYYYPESEAVETFDEEELLQDAIVEQLKRKLGQSIEVVYQKVLHQEKDSDKVKLEIFVKVLEDITKEQIIDQGD
ncbi:sporulation protein YqfD [Filobacillus milosensis]|uniref:Sporulation protein YqfD n=1 Tax=Filobacillus milosensis TaxID=94137 RepID=A0A4Y8ISS1_9BACI|nr:sporulation protein YqfD [Filobacillus milosensis]TFB24842.1 sporulation protein YqfD [Filobacillus milosensis]